MNFIKLGSENDAILVSKIVMGTDKLAEKLTESEIFYLLDMYVDAGGNCIDTARIYSGGRSEEIIGRWLKRTNRGNIIISTKGCHPHIENMRISRLSKEDMAHDIELSLKALGTDHADIYWLHRDDPSIPAGKIIEDLNCFIKSGKIRFIGCSNWKTERIKEANDYAIKNGISGFVSSQIQWSLAETREEIYRDYAIVIMNQSEYAWYLENKMPVFAYASQAQGFFPKVAKGGLDSLSEKTRARFGSEDNLKRLKILKTFAADHGISLTAASLAYIICNKLPAAAIIGCKTPEHLRDSLSAAEISIGWDEAQALHDVT